MWSSFGHSHGQIGSQSIEGLSICSLWLALELVFLSVCALKAFPGETTRAGFKNTALGSVANDKKVQMRMQRNGGSGVGAYPREKVHQKTHAVITTSNLFGATDGTAQTGILFLKSKCNKQVMVNNWICFTFSMRSYPTAPSPLYFSTNKLKRKSL